MRQAKITNHAEKRMKKRLGSGKSDYERIAQKAITNGIKHEETTGNLCKFLDKLFLSHGVGANMRVYQQKVFLFTRDFVLVTVIPLPANLIKTANKISKRKKDENK